LNNYKLTVRTFIFLNKQLEHFGRQLKSQTNNKNSICFVGFFFLCGCVGWVYLAHIFLTDNEFWFRCI